MAKSRLHQLSELGQSVWIDYLSRDMLRSGELARLNRGRRRRRRHLEPDHLPEGDLRGRRLRRAAPEELEEERDPKELFLRLAVQDVQDACDVLRSVWDEGGGQDGYVSLEVDPTLAYDTEATIAEAARLHEPSTAPNLFVKIPATEPGLPAIEEMIARGKSINVTLIFSLERYAEVAEAYIRGLERLVEAGGDPFGVASVASFFVSRVDTEADRRLEEAGAAELAGQAGGRQREARLPALQGDLRRRPLGGARRTGRDDAALPLGFDLDQEPRLPRRALRRGADRAADREHDAGGDDRGLPGPLAASRSRSRRGSTRRTRSSGGSPRPEWTTTTSPPRSSGRESTSSPTPSPSSSTGSAPSPASSSRDFRGCVAPGFMADRVW